MGSAALFTIGFTRKSAAEFFGILRQAKITKLVDVRLNNVSQLAGFTKRDDLAFFLREICGCDYEHRPLFAPTKDLLDGYKQGTIPWDEYESRFCSLLRDREVEKHMTLVDLDQACLLCSEPTADRCHRRLAAEYLRDKLGSLLVTHL